MVSEGRKALKNTVPPEDMELSFFLLSVMEYVSCGHKLQCLLIALAAFCFICHKEQSTCWGYNSAHICQQAMHLGFNRFICASLPADSTGWCVKGA